MELSTTWETVSTDASLPVKRLPVSGGWLVWVGDVANSTSSVNFVPDPLHDQWDLSTSTD